MYIWLPAALYPGYYVEAMLSWFYFEDVNLDYNILVRGIMFEAVLSWSYFEDANLDYNLLESYKGYEERQLQHLQRKVQCGCQGSVQKQS